MSTSFLSREKMEENKLWSGARNVNGCQIRRMSDNNSELLAVRSVGMWDPNCLECMCVNVEQEEVSRQAFGVRHQSLLRDVRHELNVKEVCVQNTPFCIDSDAADSTVLFLKFFSF